MTAASKQSAQLKGEVAWCAICDQPGASRKFFVAVSVPSATPSTQLLATETVYFTAQCCSECFPKIARNERTSATFSKVFGGIMVACIAALYFMFPGVPIGRMIFGALLFLGVCFGVGYMIYSVATPPQPRPKDSELTAFAKQVSREHLRNATPTLQLMATEPDCEIVAEFVMPPPEQSEDDEQPHDA